MVIDTSSRVFKVIIKALAIVIATVLIYAAVLSLTTPLNTNWNKYVTADVTFADGSTRHFDSNVFVELNKGDHITVHVKFPEDEKIKHSSLCFSVNNAKIKISTHGEVFYTHGYDLEKKGVMIGNAYPVVQIPKEAWGSEITIDLYVTEDGAFSRISQFNLYPTNKAYLSFFSNDVLDFLISFPICILSLLTLFVLFVSGGGTYKKKSICIGFFALFAGLWIFTNSGIYNFFSTAYFWVPLKYILLSILLLPLYAFLWLTVKEKKCKIQCIVVGGLGLLLAIVASILNFTTQIHFCKLLPIIYIFLLVEIVMLLKLSIVCIKRNDVLSQYFIIGTIITLVIGLIDLFRLKLALEDGGGTQSILAIGLLTSLLIVLLGIVEELRSERDKQIIHEEDIQHLEEALETNRIKVMVNQMQPHFLYNALSAIRAIVKTSPDYAYDLLYDFTIYLRSNIKALSTDALVPFTQGLRNTEAYLNIERMRFGDKLKVEYDIQAKDFELPALSVQPLVENAVRHGIYPKGEDGGTVFIQSRETDTSYILIVEDNGVGFDFDKTLHEKTDSVGFKNAKYRLEHMMDAKINVESTIGVGTKITITIPKDYKKKKTYRSVYTEGEK